MPAWLRVGNKRWNMQNALDGNVIPATKNSPAVTIEQYHSMEYPSRRTHYTYNKVYQPEYEMTRDPLQFEYGNIYMTVENTTYILLCLDDQTYAEYKLTHPDYVGPTIKIARDTLVSRFPEEEKVDAIDKYFGNIITNNAVHTSQILELILELFRNERVEILVNDNSCNTCSREPSEEDLDRYNTLRQDTRVHGGRKRFTKKSIQKSPSKKVHPKKSKKNKTKLMKIQTY